MKKILLVLFAAALLGGCAKQSDSSSNSSSTQDVNTSAPDCSGLDNVGPRKAAKYQVIGAPLMWKHITFSSGTISSIPVEGIPAISGSYTCEKSNLNFMLNTSGYEIKTNVGEVEVIVINNDLGTVTVNWKENINGHSPAMDTYIKG
jgi:hypothetical protein